MSKRNRPSAFEVSFGESQETKKKKSSNVGDPSGSSSSVSRYKARPREQLPVTYYKPSNSDPKVTLETEELSLEGEDPYEDTVNHDGRGKKRRKLPATAEGGEEKPVRILTNFTAYDRNHGKEMVAVDVCETPEGTGRDLVVVGYARPLYEGNNSEDDGQDDEEDEEDLPFLQLSAVLKLDIGYTNFMEPVYIETSWAWYRLDSPSERYEPVHTHFMFPESVAQIVLSNAKHHRNESLKDFLDKFKNMRYMHYKPFEEQDLWNSVPQILGGLRARKEEDECIVSAPLIQTILKLSGAFTDLVTMEKDRPRPPVRQRPATSHPGNPDDAALKEANQNATQVTPSVAKLASGLVEEQLRVVGPRPPQPNQTELDKITKDTRDRVFELVNKAKKRNKDIRWDKDDRVHRGSRHVKRIQIEGAVYSVGDVVIVPNEFRRDFWESKDFYDIDLKSMPPDAKLHDLFWFAKIQSISHDTFTAHIQWFEHGAALLQELAHDQQLYLSNLCGGTKLQSILGKVNVHYKVPTNQWKTIGFQDFICNSLYNHGDGSFVDLPDDTFTKEIPPPDNCPACALREQQAQENICMSTYAQDRTENGFTHRGHRYHYEEFVAYYSDSDEDRGANIGYITEIHHRAGWDKNVGSVKCKKVGRIVDLKDILPEDMMCDERHLFLTDEDVDVNIDHLLGVVFAPCKEALTRNPTLQQWLDFSPEHFFVEYRFPTSQPTSWDQKVKIRWNEHAVCNACCNERLEEVKTAKKFVASHKGNPLKALDIFAGVGAFSHSITQACGAIKLTHAIEVAPSAAHTIKHNFPDVTVYNQCANTMLQYTLKTWEGHSTVRRPYQLYDEDIPVPPPPKKGEIKVIIGGFPCQSHSGLNIYRRADDIKSNLLLNALSWIDAIRPYYVFLENVQGFLSYRLNATQASKHRVEGGIEMGGLKLLVRAMLDMGYQVRFALLNAAHYGAPQRRLRFFLIGALSGHPLPNLPQPSHAYAGPSLDIKFPYYLQKELLKSIRVAQGTALHKTVTVEDAISDLPRFDWKPPQTTRRSGPIAPRRTDANGKYVPLIECTKEKTSCGPEGAPPYHHKAKTRFQAEARTKGVHNLQHVTKVFKPDVVKMVTLIPPIAKADYRNLPARHQEWQTSNPESHIGRSRYKSGPYGRLDKDGVFPTIVTNVAPTAKQSQVLHYVDNRIVTLREHARGQGFPDWFEFKAVHGRTITIHRQIGNAVPWHVGRALGRQLRISLVGKWIFDQQNAIQVDDSEGESDVDMPDADDMYASS